MMDTPVVSDETTKPAPSIPAPTIQAARRRGFGGLAIHGLVLAGLAWLTFANATSSRALIEAVEAERRGDFPASLASALEHLDRRPWSREASRIAARCLSRLDFAERAEPYYRRARDLSVSDLRYRAYGLTRANLREEALRAYDEVLARQPDDVASLRLKAGVLMAMSRFNEATEPPSRIAGPGSGMMIEVSRWGDVAEIGRRLSGFPQGSTEVETPITLGGHWTFRPRPVSSVPALGATLEAMAAHNQGDAQGAVEAFERVLALDPELRSMPLERRSFWTQLGQDLLAIGRASDAVRWLGVEDEGRSDPVVIALLASAHSQLGAVGEAEAAWRRVLERAPGHASAWLNLGRIESGRGNAREAARLLTRAAELAPDSFDAAYNLGLAYRKLGRPDDARKWELEAGRLLRIREETLRKRHLAPSS